MTNQDWQPESNHPWANHAPTYRAKEVQELANWIVTGASGSLIGLSGTGKSDFLGFLCHRPQALQNYLPKKTQPFTILYMDLNTLPAPSLSALFRVILRAFYEHKSRFSAESHEVIDRVYLENREQRDPFISQSGLRELLLHMQQRRHRVVFALDRFDVFSTMLTPKMGDSLRGLRDGFKETLSYIACMTHSLAYLPNPEAIGDLKRLLDQQICVLGPMTEQDTRDTIIRRTTVADVQPNEDEATQIWQLTGGYPSLVMQTCRWWLTTADKPPLIEWPAILMQKPNIYHRLEDIWSGLTQEEQLVLTKMHQAKLTDTSAQQDIAAIYESALISLLEKRLLVQEGAGYRPFSALFADYVAAIEQPSRGRIRHDPTTQTLYHGPDILDGLAPKERAILQYLTQNPHVQHTYTDIIVAAWSDEERYNGVTNDSLFQVIRTLRQKIEPVPSKPVYVVNWRGKPEGGYQFFPEGRPG